MILSRWPFRVVREPMFELDDSYWFSVANFNEKRRMSFLLKFLFIFEFEVGLFFGSVSEMFISQQAGKSQKKFHSILFRAYIG